MKRRQGDAAKRRQGDASRSRPPLQANMQARQLSFVSSSSHLVSNSRLPMEVVPRL